MGEKGGEWWGIGGNRWEGGGRIAGNGWELWGISSIVAKNL